MTITEVAETIQMSQATVRKYVLHNTIPHLKIQAAVRFIPSEIQGWLVERKKGVRRRTCEWKTS